MVLTLLIGSTAAKSLQSCLTLCNLMDYSPPGSSVHGTLQARILEWVAMPSSRGIFPTQGSNQCHLCLLHWQAGSLPLTSPGKPNRLEKSPKPCLSNKLNSQVRHSFEKQGSKSQIKKSLCPSLVL